MLTSLCVKSILKSIQKYNYFNNITISVIIVHTSSCVCGFLIDCPEFGPGPCCYNFSYFVLLTYVFSLFLEVSHGTAALTHFSLTHIAATLLTHSTAVVLTHSIAILIALPHWCSIYSGQFCRLFSS